MVRECNLFASSPTRVLPAIVTWTRAATTCAHNLGIIPAELTRTSVACAETNCGSTVLFTTPCATERADVDRERPVGVCRTRGQADHAPREQRDQVTSEPFLDDWSEGHCILLCLFSIPGILVVSFHGCAGRDTRSAIGLVSCRHMVLFAAPTYARQNKPMTPFRARDQPKPTSATAKPQPQPDFKPRTFA